MCCNDTFLTVDEFYETWGYETEKTSNDCAKRYARINIAMEYLYTYIKQFDNAVCTAELDITERVIQLPEKIARVVSFLGTGTCVSVYEQSCPSCGCDTGCGCTGRMGYIQMQPYNVGLPLNKGHYSYCEGSDLVSYNLPNGTTSAYITYIPLPNKVSQGTDKIEIPSKYMPMFIMALTRLEGILSGTISDYLLSLDSKLQAMLAQEKANVEKDMQFYGRFVSQ